MQTNRRALLVGFAALPFGVDAAAQAAHEIAWEDLIPPGVSYSEIVGDGDYDEQNYTWPPDFDGNSTASNETLNGSRIKMPGYMLSLETGGTGITEFILTPYVGACIRAPLPPPNQLVFGTSKTPWPAKTMRDAIWVIGLLRMNPISINLAKIGYQIEPEEIELYEWI